MSGVLVVMTDYGIYYPAPDEVARFEREYANEPGVWLQPYDDEGEPRWEPGWQKKLWQHAHEVMRKEYEQ